MTPVLFLWSRASGYMASCWRALQAKAGIDLQICYIDALAGDPTAPPFGTEILDGLAATAIRSSDAESPQFLDQLTARVRPAAVVVAGWQYAGYRSLFRANRGNDVPLILCADNPFRGDWRQRVGYWRVRPMLLRADRIAVPGKRGAALMDFWRVPSGKVFQGLYGIDAANLQRARARRDALPEWPKRFICVGRMEPRKGIDLLLQAYAAYRRNTHDPWELRLVGRGPLAAGAANLPGVSHADYVAPHDLPLELAAAGAFVLPSRYDAWPLAIVEAAAAGLPIIASDACGSVSELVEPEGNGLVVPSGSSAPLAEALTWIAEHADVCRDWGVRSAELSKPYGAEAWANVWHRQLQPLIR